MVDMAILEGGAGESQFFFYSDRSFTSSPLGLLSVVNYLLIEGLSPGLGLAFWFENLTGENWKIVNKINN